MFRVEESRRARFARTALPAAVTLLCAALAGLALLVLLHVREKRAIVAEGIAGRTSAERALREIAPIIGSDVVLAGGALILAIAVSLAIATGWRAYSLAQRRLRELKIFAADVLESVATGVVTLDLSGRVTAINGRAAQCLGIDPSRTRIPYGEVFARQPILCDAAERLLQRRTPFRNLEISIAAGGSDAPRTLSIDGSFLETTGGERIGAVIQVADVGEQRCVEREVRRSERLAALGTLAASVAHEVRNPLAALDINLQLLREALAAGRAKGETDRYVRVIESELRRLDGIVENFIRFARSGPLERAPLALGKLVEETLDLIVPECRSHGVRLERRGLDGAHPPVLAAEGELKQALLNVVLNAMQAMPDGGALAVSLDHGPARATISEVEQKCSTSGRGSGPSRAASGSPGGLCLPGTERSRSFFRLSVRDSGPGIPARIGARVFDPFFTTREGGTGLGLPIAKKILEAHGGDIGFETGEGGTTFTLLLPVDAAPAARAAPGGAPAPVALGPAMREEAPC